MFLIYKYNHFFLILTFVILRFESRIALASSFLKGAGRLGLLFIVYNWFKSTFDNLALSRRSTSPGSSTPFPSIFSTSKPHLYTLNEGIYWIPAALTASRSISTSIIFIVISGYSLTFLTKIGLISMQGVDQEAEKLITRGYPTSVAATAAIKSALLVIIISP